jgi:DPCD (Primary Ciliary Dyskinesia) family protein
MEFHEMSLFDVGRKKVHTAYEDGHEMVEEFDVRTDQLVGGWQLWSSFALLYTLDI